MARSATTTTTKSKRRQYHALTFLLPLSVLFRGCKDAAATAPPVPHGAVRSQEGDHNEHCYH